MIPSLQAYRAVAALLVVAQHLNIALGKFLEGPLSEDSMIPIGKNGVQFFFVLSGFLLFHVHRAEAGRAKALPLYLGKRANRIYPIYWIVTLALLPVWYLVPSFGEDYHRDWGALVASLLLVPQSHDPHLTVAWTLVHEAIFYLFFSLFFLTTAFRRFALFWAAAIGVHCILPVSHWLAGWLLSPYNLLFLAGLVLAALQEPIRARLPTRLLVAVGLAAQGLGFALALGTGFHLAAQIVFAGSAIALIAASGRPAVECLFARRRWLLLLGDASYAIYLLHFPLMIGMAKGLGRIQEIAPLPLPLHAALLFGSALVGGILLHLWVEKPLFTLGRRWLAKRSARSPISPPLPVAPAHRSHGAAVRATSTRIAPRKSPKA